MRSCLGGQDEGVGHTSSKLQRVYFGLWCGAWFAGIMVIASVCLSVCLPACRSVCLSVCPMIACVAFTSTVLPVWGMGASAGGVRSLLVYRRMVYGICLAQYMAYHIRSIYIRHLLFVFRAGREEKKSFHNAVSFFHNTARFDVCMIRYILPPAD